MNGLSLKTLALPTDRGETDEELTEYENGVKLALAVLTPHDWHLQGLGIRSVVKEGGRVKAKFSGYDGIAVAVAVSDTGGTKTIWMRGPAEIKAEFVPWTKWRRIDQCPVFTIELPSHGIAVDLTKYSIFRLDEATGDLAYFGIAGVDDQKIKLLKVLLAHRAYEALLAE